MGNEAIARGAIEAGTYVMTGYPGTPSSEVLMTVHEFGKGLDIYAEWAANERVAFEIALGAAIGGARALVTMKAPGANVAADPILSAAYSGVDGGLVILIADDPGPITTQTEQDSRWFAELSKLPMITPSNPQEAKDFVVIAHELSEAVNLPVILRTTTRVNHTVGPVETGEIKPPKKYVKFVRNPPRFVRAGMVWNRERHAWLLQQLGKVEDFLSKYGLNMVEGSGSKCVVTEGVGYEYVMEALSKLGLKEGVKVVKLGLLYPFPKRFMSEVLRGCDEVLVVEELDPYIEFKVKELAYELKLDVKVAGKAEKLLPEVGELTPSTVLKAMKGFLHLDVHESEGVERLEAPPRPPPLCPSCPHRNSYIGLIFGILKAGFRREEVPIFGDIGCYALSVNPPINAIWTEHSMGASIGMAMGLKLSGFKGPVVATIGDSTLFHAGLPALAEAIHKKVDMLVLILDNEVVAMTGHQSTLTWGKTELGRETKPLSIEEVVKGMGADTVVVVDPYDIDRMISTVKELIRKPGVNVIIARAPCALHAARLYGVQKRYTVIPERCKECMACIKITGCPALYIGEDHKVHILVEDCLGCGLCAKYCPFDAIVEVSKG
ncbi:MAG: indolepyruvate ferredoxin oxidoreductase subunit alpha [Desulfurococcales archaeon]|nr:indolepyruvate ferredoxin oxidoreductase subunit alpha [Desulfurococcales archaeon]